jgi:cyclic pyranopterin phosphate synthase
MAFVDRFGREVRKLRLSVTDRCNFRCTYCLPVEPTWLPRAEILSFEEIERVVRALVPQGVRKLRLTGGEPLLRRDLERLVARLARVPGVEGLAMTSNGYFLAEKAKALREAGLRSITVSLDALDAATFDALARRPAFARVMAGIEAALAAGFPEIKINSVILRGVNEGEVVRLAELARSGPFVVRFIEFMPLDSGGGWDLSRVVVGAEVRRRIEERWPLEPVAPPVAGSGRDPAARYRFRDGRGEVGFISSVSEPFCASCDRIRLTADGKLLNCLFGLVDYGLRALLRGDAGDEELIAAVRRAVEEKEAGHLINRPGFIQPRRAMAGIGG